MNSCSLTLVSLLPFPLPRTQPLTHQDALIELQNNLSATSTELDIEKRESSRLKLEVIEQADQLKEMAEKVFQLIDRLQQAESAKQPAEQAAVKVGQDLREAKERILRLETERAEAGKLKIPCTYLYSK